MFLPLQMLECYLDDFFWIFVPLLIYMKLLFNGQHHIRPQVICGNFKCRDVVSNNNTIFFEKNVNFEGDEILFKGSYD